MDNWNSSYPCALSEADITSFEMTTRHACSLRESHFTQHLKNILLVASQVYSLMINTLDHQVTFPGPSHYPQLPISIPSPAALPISPQSHPILHLTNSSCYGVFPSSSSAGFCWFLQLISAFQRFHFSPSALSLSQSALAATTKGQPNLGGLLICRTDLSLLVLEDEKSRSREPVDSVDREGLPAVPPHGKRDKFAIQLPLLVCLCHA